jgi:hypothetical protein
VVRRDVREAQNLQVEFRWLPGEPIEATLLTSVDVLMDLAVLVVDEEKHKIPLSVYLVGHPGGRLWLDDVTPDKVSRKSANSIRRDRVLSSLFLRDDDFAVIVLTQAEGSANEGTLYFLRKTNNGWRIAGLWG